MPVVQHPKKNVLNPTAILVKSVRDGVDISIPSVIPAFMAVVYCKYPELIPPLLILNSENNPIGTQFFSRFHVLSPMPNTWEESKNSACTIAVTYPIQYLDKTYEGVRMVDSLLFPIRFNIEYNERRGHYIRLQDCSKSLREIYHRYRHTGYFWRLLKEHYRGFSLFYLALQGCEEHQTNIGVEVIDKWETNLMKKNS